MEAPTPVDWMTSGGAYWLIGGTWIVIAIFYFWVAQRVGSATQAESDGCLLGGMNVLLTIFGGGAGLLLLQGQYPAFVASSMFGALLFPTLGTLFILRRMRRS